MIATGGKAVYGAEIGILMLAARFPRIPGDMGNARTWPFPVRYKVVRGASPDLVVRQGAPGLLDAFIKAGKELVADGCTGITTNCGFLSLYQAELAAALQVPVATSSLMQASLIQTLLPPEKRVGVLTIDAHSLTPDHLLAANVPPDTPVFGTQDGDEFTRVILENETELDVEKARADMIQAAISFQKLHSNLGAILLECTNMCPYAADVSAHTGLPVFSIYDFITWFGNSLLPKEF